MHFNSKDGAFRGLYTERYYIRMCVLNEVVRDFKAKKRSKILTIYTNPKIVKTKFRSLLQA